MKKRLKKVLKNFLAQYMKLLIQEDIVRYMYVKFLERNIKCKNN